MPLYKAYVRPHLEYAVQAWRPNLRGDIDQLERVQRSFTRMFASLRTLSYPERLRLLKLFSLERRRARGDLIEVFKELKGLSDMGDRQLFQLSTSPELRGHSLKLAKPRAQTSVRQNSFALRVINSWNRLPQEVIDCDTVDTFKRKLDECWHTTFPNLV